MKIALVTNKNQLVVKKNPQELNAERLPEGSRSFLFICKNFFF